MRQTHANSKFNFIPPIDAKFAVQTGDETSLRQAIINNRPDPSRLTTRYDGAISIPSVRVEQVKLQRNQKLKHTKVKTHRDPFWVVIPDTGGCYPIRSMSKLGYHFSLPGDPK